MSQGFVRLWSWGKVAQELVASGAGEVSVCSIMGHDTLVCSCRRLGASKRSPRCAGTIRLSPITYNNSIVLQDSSNEHNFFIVKLLFGNNTSIRYSSLRWCRTLSVCDSKRFPEAKRNFFGDSKLQHLKIQRKNHNIVTMFAYKRLF